MMHFVCYLRKPGALAPEIRFVACRDVPDLPDAITSVLPSWPRFETLEVRDRDGRPMFRIGPHEGSAMQ